VKGREYMVFNYLFSHKYIISISSSHLSFAVGDHDLFHFPNNETQNEKGK
jgi:hypothetical protein